MADGTGAVTEGATTTSGTTATTTAATGATTQGNGATWFGGYEPEFQGFLQNKGWSSLADPTAAVLEIGKAYRNQEKLVGLDKLPMPKDLNDKEGYGRVYDRLGRPKTWQEYGVKVPEGGNKDYAEFMQQTFHEAGLNKAQVDLINAKSNERVQAVAQANQQQFAQRSAAELDATRKEWGPDADRNFAAAQRFAIAYEVDKPTMEKIERAIGTGPMMNLFAKIGAGLSEDRGPGTGGGGFGKETPEMAQAKQNDLMKDDAWRARYLAGGQAEVAEFDRLTRIKVSAMGG